MNKGLWNIFLTAVNIPDFHYQRFILQHQGIQAEYESLGLPFKTSLSYGNCILYQVR